MSILPGYTAWFELGMVLTIATVLMTASLLLLERMTKSAARRRLLWQAGAACVLLLLLVEATGFGPMAGAWLRGRRAESPALDNGLHDGSSEAIASQAVQSRTTRDTSTVARNRRLAAGAPHARGA